MQRGRAFDMTLLEMVVVFGSRNVEPAVRNDATFVERIFGRMTQCHEGVVPLAIREVEARRPTHGLERGIARPFEPLGERHQLTFARRAVEAAHADVDRMNLAPAEQCGDFVAGLLERQTEPHHIAMVASMAPS
jgi:hypothetical protein